MKPQFKLLASDSALQIRGHIFSPGRYLIGRSESCDIMITHDALSSVHAVLEVLQDSAIIYDMNSTNGIYVGEDKVVSTSLQVGSHFRLADVEFEFCLYVPEVNSLPDIAPKFQQTVISNLQSILPEYIFEDKEELYPIFKYESVKRAVEVIILFKESIYSIDFLNDENPIYYLSGKSDSADELEFPYLLKNQKVKLVEIHKGSCEVQNIPGFEILYVGDKKVDRNQTSFELHDNDLVKISNKDIQIIVRNVVAPPQIVASPVFKRDPEFRKSLVLSFLCLIVFLVGIRFVSAPSAAQVENLSQARLAAILNR